MSLDEQQEAKLEELLRDLHSDMKPLDLVDEWRAAPNRVGLEWEERGYEYVSVDSIVGTEGHNVERLDAGRLRRVLEMLREGQFEKEHRFPPVLCKVGSEYFVDADGNHRVLAHKYLGLEKVYAEVVEYFPE